MLDAIILFYFCTIQTTIHTLQFVFIYIYIYIVIHKHSVSLYHNSSLWLDTQDARSWDRNPPNFTLDLVSNRSVNKRTTSA